MASAPTVKGKTMRLIDPEALKKQIGDLHFQNYGWAIIAVNSAPIIDAEEVVRCKDCKHYFWDDFDCSYVCMKLGKYVKRDFFCAHGERKG